MSHTTVVITTRKVLGYVPSSKDNLFAVKNLSNGWVHGPSETYMWFQEDVPKAIAFCIMYKYSHFKVQSVSLRIFAFNWIFY